MADPPAGEASEGAAAAAAPPSLEELQAQIEELKRLLAEQKDLIEKQKEKIAKQEGDLKAQNSMLQQLLQQIESTTRRLDELQQEIPAAKEGQDSIEARLKRVEAGVEKAPELPPDVVSAGDFPGSIRIPGSDAAVKFGGMVRVALVYTLDPLGSDEQFLTNTIPVDQPPPPGEGKETNINANTSRINFELRTPTGAGQMRAFIEGDFFETNNSARLRHAYGQFHGVLAGQTWSTFADWAANPLDIDFQGVISMNILRQPMIRYTWVLSPTLNVAAAIETPSISVTGGVGSDVVPDLIGRAYWKFKGTGHLQWAGVLRQIRAAPDSDPEDFQRATGWGLSLSGLVPFRYKNLTDKFIFQVNGGYSIARYINDLSSLGGLDGVFNPTTNELETVPMIGWYFDYEHMWKRWQFLRDSNLRSALTWSTVRVTNAAFMPDDSYYLTHRLSGNLVFSPIDRMDVGVQYIWGSRENKDGNSAEARQWQFVVTYNF